MEKKPIDRKPWIIAAAFAIMIIVMLLPTPEGLSTAGQRVLAVLLFAVIMWISESMPYGESAIALILFLILSLGLSPATGTSGKLLGTVNAIPLAMSGFVNSGWVFVAAGIFLAAAVVSTGLETRIAYTVLRIFGTSTKSIIGGFIVVGFVLTFIIPSVIARAATMVPIVLGLNKAFNLPNDSQISKVLMMVVGIMPSLSGVGVLSGSAPNPVTVNFIANAGLGQITWMQWLMYNMPLCIAMGIAFYFVMTRMHKFEFDELPGGKAYLDKCVHDLGPMSAKEKRVGIMLTLTIIMWATDFIHKIDANTVSVAAVFVMLFPYIGVTTWKNLYNKVDWTAILMFGAGISLGVVLMKTGAVQWLAKVTLVAAGVGNFPKVIMAFTIFAMAYILRMAFTSITSCITAIVPAILGFLVSLNDVSVPIIGILMGVCVMAHDIFLLPVNSANTMIAYGTNSFKSQDMFRIGLPLLVILAVLLVPWVYLWWPVVGLMK